MGLSEHWKNSLKTIARQIPILEQASLAQVSEGIHSLGQDIGLEQTTLEEIISIGQELAQVHLTCARRGEICLSIVHEQGQPGIELVALGEGPGICDPVSVMGGSRPSLSTSAGGELTTSYRSSDSFDVDIRQGEGTCIWVRKFSRRALEGTVRPRIELAILGRPYPGETVSGDHGLFKRGDDSSPQFKMAIADGVGHGPLARQASSLAIAQFQRFFMNQDLDLITPLKACHTALQGTRGAVAGLILFDPVTRKLQSALLGDIMAQLYTHRPAFQEDRTQKCFQSTPFVLGQTQQSKFKFLVEECFVPSGSTLILFTDGLRAQTTLHQNYEVLKWPAMALAQHLIETYSKNTDDALVIVAKFP